MAYSSDLAAEPRRLRFTDRFRLFKLSLIASLPVALFLDGWAFQNCVFSPPLAQEITVSKMRRETGGFTKESSVSSSKSRTSERRKYFSDGYRMHQTSVLGSCRAAEARKEIAAVVRNQGQPRSLVGSIGTHLDVSTHLDGTRTPGRHSLAPRFAFFGITSIPIVLSTPAKPSQQPSLQCLPCTVSFQQRDL
jgi:hypothetical protein